MTRRFFLGVFAVCLAGLAASFAGRLHPVGDTIAVFRFWLAVAAMVCAMCVLRGGLRWAAGIAVLATFAVQPVLVSWELGRRAGPFDYAVYQKNMLFENDALAELEADIRQLSPDFIFFQEVSRANLGMVTALRQDQTAAAHCARRRTSSLVILSKFPRTDADFLCPDTNGVLAMQVATPDGPLWLVNIHLRWPWPFSQPQNLQEIVPELAKLSGPMLVGGDFNAVAWSDAVRQIEVATATKRLGPIQNTYFGHGRAFAVPIDHVLTPDGTGRIDTRPLLGSDHLGLLAEFNLGISRP